MKDARERGAASTRCLRRTTYVAGSTTLTAPAVADVGGLSPLVNGMPIQSPARSDAGFDACGRVLASTANVATITFDVVVSPTVPNATVISNQGLVSAVAGNHRPAVRRSKHADCQ